MTEIELIHTAIENLEKTTGIKANWLEQPGASYDGIIEFRLNDQTIRYETKIKNELRVHQLAPLGIIEKSIGKTMICVARMYPKVKDILRENNVAWLEGNGNIYFNTKGKLVWIETQRPLLTQKEKLNRAFTKTGLQVLFQILNNQTLIEENYRVIAEKTGTALGNVSNVFNGLKASGFIVLKNKKQKVLVNKKELLNKWITAYQDVLKPAITLGKYRFTKQEKYLNWEKIKLDAPATLWGGEPAAELLTGQLRPAEFTIYTNKSKPELMKSYRLIPDENGDVVARKKFWDYEEHESKTVPPLLIYADLMLKEEKRCRETAQLIYEQYLEKQF